MSDKYFRTYHLPWSEGATKDDKILSPQSLHVLISEPLVITEKLDGSNICLTKDACYARSHANVPAHQSFDMLKQIHGEKKYMIPAGYSLFGEYVYAVHSIKYTELDSYIYLFGVRKDRTGYWLPFEAVRGIAFMLGLKAVPKLATVNWADTVHLEGTVRELMWNKSVFGGEREGVVVRVAGGFTNPDWAIAKFVRANHVQTDEHWTDKPVEKQNVVLNNDWEW